MGPLNKVCLAAGFVYPLHGVKRRFIMQNQRTRKRIEQNDFLGLSGRSEIAAFIGLNILCGIVAVAAYGVIG